MQVREEYIVEAHYHDEASGHEAARRLMQLTPRSDALFAASDSIAIGAMDAYFKLG